MDSESKIINWNELDGTYLLNKVFSGSVKISNVDLFDISINRDGPSVIINFDLLDQLPDQAPPKWGRYNKCRCGINCGKVSDLEIIGILTKINASANIEIINGVRYVNFVSDGFKLSLKCKHIQFMGPSVYLDN
ncbi:Imm50 family immunity protein [Samsonia erythrinae]|uniref:Immunity protein 50 of polymorphic toxin system n=1 Tax=Samsonia erythrinae TaxID=160434 RepID=A0A4R3VEU4_9GAMM|nr:Imm50 family immunity protein [Samsonia erythrinae]TCV02493.1 immunity protein 50 of polymorphic toxin system [Samsonia erythrinae]